MAMTRVALIGTGEQMIKYLVPCMRLLPNLNLSYVCSRNIRQAEKYSKIWNIENYTNTWKDVLDPSMVDAVVVSVNADLHYQIARECIPKGIAIFVEKPPAKNVKQLKELIDLETKYPETRSFVGYNFAYSEIYNKLVKEVTKRSNISHAKFRFVSSPVNDKNNIYKDTIHCFLYEFAIHPINLALRLMGRPLDVSCNCVRLAGGELSLTVNIEHERGRLSSLELGTYGNRFEYDCELISSDATVGRMIRLNSIEVTKSNATEQNEYLSEFGDKYYVRYDWPLRRGGYKRTGYFCQLDKFFDSVHNKSNAITSFRESLETLNVLDRLYEKIAEYELDKVIND